MKKYNLLGIFLLGFLLMSASFGLVAADDDDEIEEEGREIKIDTITGGYKIESEGEDGDKLSFTVKSENEGLSIKVEFNSSKESDDTEVEFKVVFSKLVEYVDSDLVDYKYDEDQDEYVNTSYLDEFQAAIYTETTTDDGKTLHYIKMTTIDNVFTAHVYIVGELSEVNGLTVTPTEMKIDIEINNFPYSEDNSQLALATKMESTEKIVVQAVTADEGEGNADDEQGIATFMNGYSGFLTWAEQAEVYVNGIGEFKDVLTSFLEEEETEKKIYLNYPRGNIYHDPKVGISLAQSSSSILPIVLTGTAVSIILIGIVVVVLIRKRRIA